jgi:hypothetical protein
MSPRGQETVQVQRASVQELQNTLDVICGNIDSCKKQLALLDVSSNQTSQCPVLLKFSHSSTYSGLRDSQALGQFCLRQLGILRKHPQNLLVLIIDYSWQALPPYNYFSLRSHPYIHYFS